MFWWLGSLVGLLGVVCLVDVGWVKRVWCRCCGWLWVVLVGFVSLGADVLDVLLEG